MKIPYRNPWLIGIVILIIIGGIWWYRSRSSTTTTVPTTAQVKRGTLVESVSGSGSVVAKIQADVSASGQGRVEQLLVKDGDIVKADQALLRIKSLATPQDIAQAYASMLGDIESVTTAQQKLQDAQKNEAIAKTSLSGSTLAYNKSKIDAQKTVSDANKGVIDASSAQEVADTDLEALSAETGTKSATLNQQASRIKSKVDVNTAQKTLQEAERDYDSTALKTTSATQSYDAAKAGLAASRLNYQSITNQLLTAPVGGTVMNLSLVEGGTVGTSTSGTSESASESLFSIVDLTSLRAQVSVSEVDISSVKIDQPATLTFDALSGKTLTGKVISIDRLGTTTSGVTTYNVEISFDTIDETIRPGMSVNANIITAHKNDALLVPNAAIQPQGDQNVVTVIRNGSQTTVPITLGSSNDLQTEIISGLQEGDEVITGTSTATGSSAFSSGNSFGGGGGARIGF
ncbi:MAG: efflux RND transporter periplasmic adaptor subunit [Patescibacteria group bacterium]